jgi:serine/threonine protein kinase
MGTVYLADDVKLERRVALKVLLGSLARNPQQVGRFQREAQAAAPLQHPNIVRIHEAGILAGVPFIAMEFVEGEPLDRFLRRNGTVTWQQGLRIAEQVSEGLSCAHEAGVVHRDVKPANILLDKTGRVRLTDFGIARMRDRHTGYTEHDTFLGTPEFMSPEQCAGSAEVGPESDLFSLGVTLYRMLSGRLPFTGETTVGVVDAITSRTPERLSAVRPDIPDDVSRLVAHLLEKDPRERPHSARALITIIQRIRAENGGVSALPKALDQFIREQSEPRTVRATTPTPPEKSPRKKSRRKTQQRRFYKPISPGVQLAAAVLILVTFAAVGLWQFTRVADSSRPAPALAAAVTRAPDGHTQLALPHPDWTITGLRWVASKPVVILEVAGRAGTVSHGRHGILAFDVITEDVNSVAAPVATDQARWAPGLHRIADASAAAYLGDTLLVANHQDRGADPLIAVWGQSWDRDRPAAAPVCVIPADTIAHLHPVAGGTRGYAIPAPTGDRVALLTTDPRTGNPYLMERAVQAGRAGNMVHRTDGSRPVIPGSVQYAPDGNALTYICETAPGDRALWRLDSPGDQMNGTPLLTGNLLPEYAWSLNQNLIACTVADGSNVEVAILDIVRGRVTQNLGPGAVSPEAWHPSGRYLLVESLDPSNRLRRVVAVQPDRPDTAVPLLPECQDAQHTAAISRDGRWAAMAVETRAGTVLRVVDLSSVFLGGSVQTEGA